jgi:hypothetical protein
VLEQQRRRGHAAGYSGATDEESYKLAKVQSTLGGAYLRMYLAGLLLRRRGIPGSATRRRHISIGA